MAFNLARLGSCSPHGSTFLPLLKSHHVPGSDIEKNKEFDPPELGCYVYWANSGLKHARKLSSLQKAFPIMSQTFLRSPEYVFSHLFTFGSLWPHGLSPIWLLCPWDFPSKNTGVGRISYSRRSSQPRDQTCVSCVSCIGGRLFIPEPPGKPLHSPSEDEVFTLW